MNFIRVLLNGLDELVECVYDTNTQTKRIRRLIFKGFRPKPSGEIRLLSERRLIGVDGMKLDILQYKITGLAPVESDLVDEVTQRRISVSLPAEVAAQLVGTDFVSSVDLDPAATSATVETVQGVPAEVFQSYLDDATPANVSGTTLIGTMDGVDAIPTRAPGVSGSLSLVGERTIEVADPAPPVDPPVEPPVVTPPVEEPPVVTPPTETPTDPAPPAEEPPVATPPTETPVEPPVEETPVTDETDAGGSVS